MNFEKHRRKLEISFHREDGANYNIRVDVLNYTVREQKKKEKYGRTKLHRPGSKKRKKKKTPDGVNHPVHSRTKKKSFFSLLKHHWNEHACMHPHYI